MTDHAMPTRDADMQACIERCMRCHATCVETISYCLRQGGRHAEPAHIALMATCADICATSAAAMLRGAEVHAFTCEACARICTRCADDCAAMGEDAAMQRCAETCRRCAESCAAMAAA